MTRKTAGGLHLFQPEKRLRTVLVGFFLISFCCFQKTAWAIPQFALYNGERCLQCHVNASGGGLRTSRGFSEMNRTGLLQPEQMGIPFPENTRNTFLQDRLTVGADARFQTARSPKSPDAKRRYFPMQASVYSAYRIFEWLSTEASYNFGPKKYPGQQKFTASAIIHPGGFAGNIRAGFFQPSIGLRHDDHTILTRRIAGADGVSLIPPHYAELGTEITYSGIPWLSATAGIFGGNGLSENRVINRRGEETRLIQDRNNPSALARLELFRSFEGNLKT
jgi:hypothetical protein